MSYGECIALQQKAFQAYKRGDILLAVELTLRARDLLQDDQARKELMERVTAWEEEVYGPEAK